MKTKIVQWTIQFAIANMEDPEVEEMFREATGIDPKKLRDLLCDCSNCKTYWEGKSVCPD